MMIMFKNIIVKHQPEHFSGRRGKPTEKKGASRHKLYTQEMQVKTPIPQQKSLTNIQSHECLFLPRRYYHLPGSGMYYEENYLKCWELQKNLNNKNPCSLQRLLQDRSTEAATASGGLRGASWGGSDKQSQRYQTCSFPDSKTSCPEPLTPFLHTEMTWPG